MELGASIRSIRMARSHYGSTWIGSGASHSKGSEKPPTTRGEREQRPDERAVRDQTPRGTKMKGRAAVIDPVVKTVRVALPVEEAFRLFTRDMGKWWPLETHSIAADTHEGRVSTDGIVFEEHEAGRIYETMSDGSDATWGYVVTWEPPSRVVFSWKPNLTEGPETEVEVRFTPVERGTDVELQHQGWERFGEEAMARRGAYDSGWPRVLQLLKARAEG
jgi:uncharacterized protein YndB with AHSA1/START domain